RELAAEETWSVGEIRLPRGGHLLVRAAPGSTAGAYWSVFDAAMTQWIWGAPASGEPVRSDPLLPGEILLCVAGTGVAAQAITVVVRAGEETPIEVRVEPGVRQRVELAPPGEVDPWQGVALRVQRGTSPVHSTGFVVRTGNEPSSVELWLA